ncbi:YcnI family protein [Belnapia sp. F-4-1]|uniref:YcnI family copper-binding membrane protein n=1 Tax=Belnapia sp. F-4-1 TaxID=1545443 RepID=UPI0005BE9571|nr:YcnI family protein [Belnapia sp. F-4-1]
MTLRHGLAGLALLVGLAALPVAAHVTLDRAEAPADSYVRLAIRVPHGCAGAATTGIRLAVPEGLTSVRPAPKPGWALTILPGEPAPGRGEHGAAASTVKEIAWRGGPLPDDQFDEFLLMVRTPDRAGQSLWFPFIQECEGGAATRWIERAEPGQPAPRWPAYGLRLTPKP